jgi:hypothetical protein
MRNAVTLGVCQNRLDTIWRNLELFCDLCDAHTIIEVIYDHGGRHSRTAQHRTAALDSRLDFD